MNIAYIISAFKLPEQLVRLVDRLEHPSSSFLIHIDKKTPQRTFQSTIDDLSKRSNVRFLTPRVFHYRTMDHVRVSLDAIITLFDAQVPFDYVILLTGQDYPIKPNEYIRDFLSRYSGKSFLEYFSLPTEKWTSGGMDRIGSWNLYFLGRRFAFPPFRSWPIRRRFPRGFVPYGGPGYWCLHRSVIEYIRDFVQNNEEFVRFFDFVDIPDEIFFHTVILNSSLRRQIINDDLRYIDWSQPTPPYPAILTRDDFPRLQESSKLFARKFDQTKDAEILDMIDTVLL